MYMEERSINTENGVDSVETTEIWKQVTDFPQYMVSNYGRVKNTKTGRFLNGTVNSRGYIRYDLCDNGKRLVRHGHRLVAEAFLEKEDGKDCVNHIDGNKLNNRVSNLEWCTQSENMTHAYSVLGVEAYNKKPVRCVETGEIYLSSYEAEYKTGIPNTCINRCCNKLRNTTHKLHWEFA